MTNIEKTGATFGAVITGILIVFGVSLICAIPVMLLWNWLMPMIFGLTKLTLIQSWGLSFLCGLLFRPVASSK